MFSIVPIFTGTLLEIYVKNLRVSLASIGLPIQRKLPIRDGILHMLETVNFTIITYNKTIRGNVIFASHNVKFCPHFD